jgi:hypothetical protein
VSKHSVDVENTPDSGQLLIGELVVGQTMDLLRHLPLGMMACSGVMSPTLTLPVTQCLADSRRNRVSVHGMAVSPDPAEVHLDPYLSQHAGPF